MSGMGANPLQLQGIRATLATVTLSGTLEDKLHAAAAARFDSVEIWQDDLVESSLSPQEVRRRCGDLGLSIDSYQPFRDFDSTDVTRFAANLRRADKAFDTMAALGTDTLLVVSAVSPDAVTDDDVLIEQMRILGDRAADRGLKIAYEALSWGSHVSTYEHSWDIVAKADQPALGLCLDSFHIFARASDLRGIETIAAGKLFVIQVADAPLMSIDVMQWSRHHRVLPGQGAFDIPAFLARVLCTGYAGPVSVEIFNDGFRQADPVRTALQSKDSLCALIDDTAALLARNAD
jgi:4-hydroxyphenylpyruvate dioxygenase